MAITLSTILFYVTSWKFFFFFFPFIGPLGPAALKSHVNPYVRNDLIKQIKQDLPVS